MAIYRKQWYYSKLHLSMVNYILLSILGERQGKGFNNIIVLVGGMQSVVRPKNHTIVRVQTTVWSSDPTFLSEVLLSDLSKNAHIQAMSLNSANKIILCGFLSGYRYVVLQKLLVLSLFLFLPLLILDINPEIYRNVIENTIKSKNMLIMNNSLNQNFHELNKSLSKSSDCFQDIYIEAFLNGVEE